MSGAQKRRGSQSSEVKIAEKNNDFIIVVINNSKEELKKLNAKLSPELVKKSMEALESLAENFAQFASIIDYEAKLSLAQVDASNKHIHPCCQFFRKIASNYSKGHLRLPRNIDDPTQKPIDYKAKNWLEETDSLSFPKKLPTSHMETSCGAWQEFLGSLILTETDKQTLQGWFVIQKPSQESKYEPEKKGTPVETSASADSSSVIGVTEQSDKSPTTASDLTVPNSNPVSSDTAESNVSLQPQTVSPIVDEVVDQSQVPPTSVSHPIALDNTLKLDDLLDSPTSNSEELDPLPLHPIITFSQLFSFSTPPDASSIVTAMGDNNPDSKLLNPSAVVTFEENPWRNSNPQNQSATEAQQQINEAETPTPERTPSQQFIVTSPAGRARIAVDSPSARSAEDRDNAAPDVERKSSSSKSSPVILGSSELVDAPRARVYSMGSTFLPKLPRAPITRTASLPHLRLVSNVTTPHQGGNTQNLNAVPAESMPILDLKTLDTVPVNERLLKLKAALKTKHQVKPNPFDTQQLQILTHFINHLDDLGNKKYNTKLLDLAKSHVFHLINNDEYKQDAETDLPDICERLSKRSSCTKIALCIAGFLFLGVMASCAIYGLIMGGPALVAALGSWAFAASVIAESADVILAVTGAVCAVGGALSALGMFAMTKPVLADIGGCAKELTTLVPNNP